MTPAASRLLLAAGLLGAGPAGAGALKLGQAEVPAGVCERRTGARKEVQAEGPSLNSRGGPPTWWREAKLGIFVHWGLYSVPAYATKKYSFSQIHSLPKEEYERNNPYAEWYLLTSLINGSETANVHKQRYGEEASMESYLGNFVPRFNNEVANWQPQKMAELFRKAGAEYVVLTTKHHDSFLLWPSDVVNPKRQQEHQHAKRDIVGELTRAVRGTGMEMGLYYSGGFDWSFKTCKCEPETAEYEELAYSHIEELMERYKPSVLWDDINWPGKGLKKTKRLYKLFADYLNNVCPEGTMNGRFRTGGEFNGDFGTPEYRNHEQVSAKPFEMCRGIGESFGYNAEEALEDHLTPADAVWMLVDVVAKNGNLLLDVGPAANGSIPWPQQRVLAGLGDWMRVNAEAIHGSRPYLQAGAKAKGNARYTVREGHVYALLQEVDFGAPVHLKLDELMVPTAAAELLVEGRALPLALEEGGWRLPPEAAGQTAGGGALPVVLRLKCAPGTPSRAACA